MSGRVKYIYTIILLLMIAAPARAGVVTQAIRVIYYSNNREEAVLLKNTDQREPFLVQSWVDNKGPDGTEKELSKPPFVVTPPLFRLNPDAENSLRLVYTGAALPADRESVFWLNVKAIPRAVEGEQNLLQVAVKSRIKLFWRPEALRNAPESVPAFQRDGQTLKVTNPGPRFITFQHLDIGGVSVDTTNQMVPPFGSACYALPGNVAGGELHWKTINDSGGATAMQTATLR